MRAVSLPSLDAYLGCVRASRWRVAVGGLIGLVLAALVFVSFPSRLESTSSLELAPQITYLSLGTSEKTSDFVTLDTVAYLARSDVVVSRVAKAMGVTASEARSRTSVTAQPLSSVLQIHVVGSTPRQAEAGSRAAATTLLDEQAALFHVDPSRIRLLRNSVYAATSQVVERSNTGEDPSALNENAELLQERLDTAISSNQTHSVLLERSHVTGLRPLEDVVLAMSGLMVGGLGGIATTTSQAAVHDIASGVPRPGGGASPETREPPTSVRHTQACVVQDGVRLLGNLPHVNEKDDEVSYSTPASTWTPGRLKGAFRRFVVAMFVLGVLGALAGLGLSLYLPGAWSATTSVLVAPLVGNPYNPTAQGTSLTNLETEAQVAQSDVVSARVVSDLGLHMSAHALGNDVGATLVSNTQIVRITYRSTTRSGVAATSDAYGKAFLQLRSTRRDESVSADLAAIGDRIEVINQQIGRLQKSPSDIQKRRALGGQLLNLRVQSAGLTTSDGSPGEVIVKATSRRTGLTLPRWELVAAGAVVGLLIGLAFALSRERRLQTLHTDRQLYERRPTFD